MYSGVIERAYAIGITDAWAFWHKTPKEISGILKAHAAQRKAQSRMVDYAGWLFGQYVSYAYHSPRKYPRHPFTEKGKLPDLPEESMDEETMKGMLSAFAEVNNITAKEVR